MPWFVDAAPHARAFHARYRPQSARAAVMILHGGSEESYKASRSWQLAALRMRSILRTVGSVAEVHDVVRGEVRYRYRGWNRGEPLDDALRALDELGRIAGEVPVVLIGHSMGGRVALRAASHPRVHGVLALAPWLPDHEPTGQLAGKAIVVMHGDRDGVTSADASAEYVGRARTSGARAGMVLVGQGDHAMARRFTVWHRSIADVATNLLRPEGKSTGLAAESCASEGAVLL
ncbi:alpha/beta hydrolase [Streptomyces alanosinicus]|uniref:Alpha/beta hydrolase n=1 Tax=Streptomyces alanosinicus TaxID=68171 RepID=A0A919D892_9ACTN|nr:alpha/beta fold hydrolase [Streptomyces alanosinicus]GHE12810.1 alpha/beta hydrolase [Streptomyces alanosinicus]